MRKAVNNAAMINSSFRQLPEHDNSQANIAFQRFFDWRQFYSISNVFFDNVGVTAASIYEVSGFATFFNYKHVTNLTNLAIKSYHIF